MDRLGVIESPISVSLMGPLLSDDLISAFILRKRNFLCRHVISNVWKHGNT